MGRRFGIAAALFSVILLAVIVTSPNATALTVFPMPSLSQQTSLNTSAGSSTLYASGYCYYWYYGSCYPYHYSYYYQHYYYPYSYGYYSYPYSSGYYYYPYYDNYYYTPATPKTFDLKVDTNPSGIVPVSGAGTYDQGTVASFSLTSSIVAMGSSERYVFSSWSGDFSGGTPSGTVTMDSAKTVVANYQLQNYLKLGIDPPGITGAVGEGWYNGGQSVTVGPVPALIQGGEGTRYVFQDWTIDDAPVSGNPVSVTMDAHHTVVAHYKTQYLLTVESEYGYAQGGGWYDAGSAAAFSVITGVDTSYGVRQVFDRWAGDSQSASPVTTVTMDSPLTVRAAWKTDSTILYATIALAIAAAFVVGIGVTAIAIRGQRQQARPVPSTEPKPVAEVKPKSAETAESAPKALRPARSRRRVKEPPKTNAPEESSAA